MPTTPSGLPYPSPTDPPNGPLQIQQLAEAIDPRLPALAMYAVTSNALPDIAPNNLQTIVINFPAGTFAAGSIPVVVVSAVGSSMVLAGLTGGASATSATVFARNFHATTTQSAIRVNLIAFGPKP